MGKADVAVIAVVGSADAWGQLMLSTHSDALSEGAERLEPGTRVSIFLAVFNGEQFLRKQLDSIAGQIGGQIDVWASDDGSSDSSKQILDDQASSWTRGRFHVVDGPRSGHAENFRSMLKRTEIHSDYFAFSDQDDYWHADKLEVAIRTLAPFRGVKPALYCGRTCLVDAEGKEIGCSPLFSREPSFKNAIVQSIAGGNTMVFNREAWNLVSESARRTGFVGHDWWTYLIVSGAGGEVIYDPTPHIEYRQHDGNLIGDNARWRSRINRIKRLFEGQFSKWNDRNIEGLNLCLDMLSEDSRRVLLDFQSLRAERSAFRSLSRLQRSGLYRQSFYGNLGLKAGVFFNKI